MVKNAAIKNILLYLPNTDVIMKVLLISAKLHAGVPTLACSFSLFCLYSELLRREIDCCQIRSVTLFIVTLFIVRYEISIIRQVNLLITVA